MKKSTLAIPGSLGIATLTLIATLTHADSVQHKDISSFALDMERAAIAASEITAGEIVEIELEIEDAKPIWEIDIVNEANQLVSVEIDGQTGELLSTQWDNKTQEPLATAVGLSRAIGIVKAVEQGEIVEAELENDDGKLIWEVESVTTDNQETEYRVDAITGEILL